VGLAGSRAGLTNVVRALRVRNYRVFTAGNFTSQIGYWIQRVAVGWLAWQLTHSGTWLGLVSAADLVPAIVVTPFAGVLADRVDRIRVMRTSQVLAIIIATALAALSFTDIITIYELFTLVFVLGIVNSINQPARLALIPSLVDHATLPSAVAINSLCFNMARFIGPAIAGFVIAEISTALAFVINACTYVAFSLALSRMNVAPERMAPQHHFFRQSFEGWVYAVRHPGIGQMMILFSVTTVAMRGYIDMFPGFADNIFHRGAHGLAALTASVGLGAVVGGAWMVRRTGVNGLTSLAINHTLFMALAVLVFSGLTNYTLALITVFVGGFAMVVSGISAQTLVQTAVDPSMRGRVMGLYGLVFRAGPALGALISGWLASSFGFRLPLAAGAIVCIGAWVCAQFLRAGIERALEPAPVAAVAE
jgi:MFS family permease